MFPNRHAIHHFLNWIFPSLPLLESLGNLNCRPNVVPNFGILPPLNEGALEPMTRQSKDMFVPCSPLTHHVTPQDIVSKTEFVQRYRGQFFKTLLFLVFSRFVRGRWWIACRQRGAFCARPGAPLLSKLM